MKIIGITGSSGSGKTTLSKMLNEREDVIVIDADKVVKQMSVPGTKYLNSIKEAQKRLASQKSDEFYEAYANFVISNDDEDIENKAKEILESIERENN